MDNHGHHHHGGGHHDNAKRSHDGGKRGKAGSAERAAGVLSPILETGATLKAATQAAYEELGRCLAAEQAAFDSVANNAAAIAKGIAADTDGSTADLKL